MTLEHCYQQCDQLDTGCCGFALLSVVGDLHCYQQMLRLLMLSLVKDPTPHNRFN